MKHLLGVEELSREEMERILERAESFAEVGRRDIKKVPTLRGRTIVNLFYEASTRTLSSFELAAKRLSADVVSVKSAGSSVDKGESLKDTVATLSAYDPAAIVIRSPHAGAARLVAHWTEASVINAGDGKHEHPTQALLDVFTLRQRVDSLEGIDIWIVGDVLHSRVARSCLIAFQRMGAKVTLCGPPTLIPRGIEALGCEISYDLDGTGRGRRRLRPADAARADERELRALAPRVRRPLPDRFAPARAAPAAHAPGSGEPRRRARARGDRLAAVADHHAGGERPGGPDGDPLRAPRRHRPLAARARPRAGGHPDDRSAGMNLVGRPGEAATLIIRGARLFDPRIDLDATRDVVIRDGEIAELAEPGGAPEIEGAEIVDGEGLLALPAFVDPHVHLRVPGQEHKEDLETGTRSAAAGGYCAVIAMANTSPPIDSAAVLGSVRERAEREASIPVGFVANVTRGMEGTELSEMAELRDAGAIGFSDDGLPIANARVLRRALQYQRLAGGLIALHEEDPELSAGGVMHEGEVSAALGMAGVPSVSESTMIARDCSLALFEDAPIHVQHLSARASVEEVARAKAAGVRITCEATPHHLTLTDEAVRSLDARFKMNPPLRSEDDRQALIDGLRDGTIDCIATDHAPHASEEKEVPFEEAAWGVTGLETAFAALYTDLVLPGVLSLELLVERITCGGEPFGIEAPRLEVGAGANVTLIDPELTWTVGEEGYESRSYNNCFAGRELTGRVLMTVAGGQVAFRQRSFALGVAS